MEEERSEMRELSRAADGVCRMILSGIPREDLEIAKNRVRALAEELFPGCQELFEMIYESRWRRIRDFAEESRGCRSTPAVPFGLSPLFPQGTEGF